MNKNEVIIIGGGLAGCEAAWQLAEAGIRVRLYEMKPQQYSPAHRMEGLAELVCSNSFRSDEPETAIGLLKEEMRSLGSLVLDAAGETRVPAGKALAVDRVLFSRVISEKIATHPNITVVRKEIATLDDPELGPAETIVVAAGPLAGESLTQSLGKVVGVAQLYFYDAIAPIVFTESVDMTKAFWGSRYRPEEDDYLNCPMSEEEYFRFREALLAGEKVACREFEREIHFEGCLPIETMAERGELTMAFGPLKPKGLPDPRTGKEPFAVVQLRAENREKSMLNLVGFQTKLKYPEQKRIFSMIPGLENADFVRLGSIHRNTFVNAPRVLSPDLELTKRPGIFLAGQITGVEGYVESAACGLWVGVLLARKLKGQPLVAPPQETVLGSLLVHLQTESKNFQPMNANFGLTPPLKARGGKAKRKLMYAQRAREAWKAWKDS
ncbi:MAG: methylenetetrahydrofolate--tRNA-(uracil(54)-C(5))-methyltransferase (FADH(2)-oxidizing) TrmFO [bacterium]